MKTCYILFSLILLLTANNTFAQLNHVEFDSTGLKIIKISHADTVVGYNNEKQNYQSLIGAVIIEHDGFTMTCDSAHFYSENNSIEAFNNVNIIKANGSSAHAEYIKYTGSNNTAFMKGNVQIIDGENTLNTEELTYNIKTKIGKYFKSGTIQTKETTISSEEGSYNGFSQQTYFKKNVYVTNEEYTVESKELTYNIKTKVVKLLDESTINTKSSTIRSKSGTYDSKNGQAIFNTRTTVESEDQIIIGNKLTYNEKNGNATAIGKVEVTDIKNNSVLFADQVDYNKKSGNGKATNNVIINKDNGKNLLYAQEAIYNKLIGYVRTRGNVVIIDTEQKSILKAEIVEFNENSSFMIATINPKLITLAEKDSLFMRADTLMNIRKRDEHKLQLININTDKKSSPIWVYNLLYADSTFRNQEDEEDKHLIIGNHHVKIYSDSMQAVCDSIIYNQQDSIFKLFKKPIVWSKNQQSDADTIYIQTANNKLKEINLKGNSFLLSQIGYTTYYDQIAGNYIDAYFEDDDLNLVHVNQNAESLYYGKDDDEKFIGLNKTESSEINVYFKDHNSIQRIAFIEEPKQIFIPIDKLNDSNKYLTQYRMLTDKKPQSKKEILEN